MVVLGLLAATTALTAVPKPASAQLPGILGEITRPLGALLGGPRHFGRRHYSRKASRSRAPVAVQTQPPAAAVAGGAAAAGGAAVAAAAAATPTEAKPAATEAQPEKTAAPAPRPAEANAAAPAPEKPAPAATANAAPPPSGQDSAPKDSAAKDSFAAASKPVAPPPAQPAPQATAVPAVAVAQPAPPAAPTPVPEAPAVAAPAAAANPPATTPPVAARGASQRNAALAKSGEQQSEAPPTTATTTNQQSQRGQNRLGLAGPLAWPTAFEDVIGFTLWPGEYGERLRGHGIGDVMSAVMVSSKDLMARVRGGVAMTQGSKDDANTSGNVCNIDPAAEQWPVSQIEQSLQLNDKQRDALKGLKIAFSEAAANVKAACRDEASIAPVERLRAMQGTLWAIHDAVQGLRAPLAKFYDTLTDEQRQKFAAPASAQTDPRSMSPGQIARLCGAPPATGRQAQQAEQQLNLNKTERASLDAFQKKAGEMGQFLMASCLKPVASTPVERIDAAADRLTAVIFAASSVSLALNDFYNQLNEEQKSKFNAALR
jgi:hypothetical protein